MKQVLMPSPWVEKLRRKASACLQPVLKFNVWSRTSVLPTCIHGKHMKNVNFTFEKQEVPFIP
jgi:hypothetical protein